MSAKLFIITLFCAQATAVSSRIETDANPRRPLRDDLSSGKWLTARRSSDCRDAATTNRMAIAPRSGTRYDVLIRIYQTGIGQTEPTRPQCTTPCACMKRSKMPCTRYMEITPSPCSTTRCIKTTTPPPCNTRATETPRAETLRPSYNTGCICTTWSPFTIRCNTESSRLRCTARQTETTLPHCITSRIETSRPPCTMMRCTARPLYTAGRTETCHSPSATRWCSEISPSPCTTRAKCNCYASYTEIPSAVSASFNSESKSPKPPSWPPAWQMPSFQNGYQIPLAKTTTAPAYRTNRMMTNYPSKMSALPSNAD